MEHNVLYTCKCKSMQIRDMGTHIATTKAIDCQISRSYITGKCIRCQTPFRIYWSEWMSPTIKSAQGPEASTEQEIMFANGSIRP